MAMVVESSGLLFLARFVKREVVTRGERQYSQIHVQTFNRDGSTRDRFLAVDRYDYQTGEITGVWDRFEHVPEGAPVALRVQTLPSAKGPWLKVVGHELCAPAESAEFPPLSVVTAEGA